MAIRFVIGDLLDTKAPLIGHQVNCRGVMKAGVANQIRKKYPSVAREYTAFCRSEMQPVLLGRTLFLDVRREDGSSLCVANLFGQDGYGRDKVYTDYTALGTALSEVRTHAENAAYTHVAFPCGMGCGLAGGDWSIVYDLISKAFLNSTVGVELYLLEPTPNIFGRPAKMRIDGAVDSIVRTSYCEHTVFIPESLFRLDVPCCEGMAISYATNNSSWKVEPEDREEAENRISSLWDGLNFVNKKE